MKKIIEISEVASMAFGGDEVAAGMVVDDAIILAAQQKYIKPVLGSLWSAVLAGDYEELCNDYVKPALAQWVKYMVLPALSAQVGVAGLVNYGGDGFSPADDKALVRVVRLARSSAEALTRVLVDHIEKQPELYPEYDSAQNILNSVSIAGGVVL